MLLAVLPPQAHDDPELLALLAYRELSGRSHDAAADYLLLAERRADSTPPEARYRVNLALASTRLALARRRGDLDTALLEAGPFLEPVEARTPRELVLGGDARAVALMNLAIVELWSSRQAEAEGHLEQALALARDIDRPFVEIASLSYLGLLESRRSFVRARARCEEALRGAEAHGWTNDPVTGTALAALASMDAAQGRFEEARTRLERAAPLLRDEIDPAGAMFVHFVQGDVYAGEGRFAEAVGALRQAERLQRVLATRHLLTGPVRAAITLIQLRAGDITAARSTLAALGNERARRCRGAARPRRASPGRRPGRGDRDARRDSRRRRPGPPSRDHDPGDRRRGHRPRSARRRDEGRGADRAGPRHRRA